ncbi:hypothetical protein OSTOST_16936, partial [Ostertagia ostertagi]
MRKLFVLPAYFILGCFTSPVTQHVNAVDQKAASELASFTDAFDLTDPITPSSLQCLRDGYKTAFIRAYTSLGQGKVDPNAVANIKLAAAVGLRVEVFMAPQSYSNKTGAQQLDEMYSSLLDSNIVVKSVWLQVIL